MYMKELVIEQGREIIGKGKKIDEKKEILTASNLLTGAYMAAEHSGHNVSVGRDGGIIWPHDGHIGTTMNVSSIPKVDRHAVSVDVPLSLGIRCSSLKSEPTT